MTGTRNTSYPKGAVVVLNWWAIHYDSALWAQPILFDPSRYLHHAASTAHYMNTADPFERNHFSYGAGLRACYGIHVAERSLFIDISRVLWGFDIRNKKGPDGKAVDVTDKMMPGFFSVLEPFECDIMPRPEKYAQMMREAGVIAEKEWEAEW
ncbi:hypothetical protein ACN47E_001505 [Coniothyrium glycines]